MIYLFNQYITPNKPIKQGLTAIYGINQQEAQKIGNHLCINTAKRLNTLKVEQIRRISKYIMSNYKIGGLLQKQKLENIKKKIKIKTYQGNRHVRKLPVRGQRTRTNAQTQRKRK